MPKTKDFHLEISNPGFDAAVSDVQNGNADGMIAGMTVTDARKATFDFSDPYYTTNSILAVQESSNIASYEDLKGKNSWCQKMVLLLKLPRGKQEQVWL